MGTRYRGTPREERALNAYIKLMRCANSVQGRLERRLRRLGVTDNQFGVLEALLHLGPVAQHELGRALFTSRANITTIGDTLERRALVRRERDATDRRYVTVHLSDAGRALIERLFPDHLAAIVAEFAALNAAEQEELGRLCKQLGLRGGAAAGGPSHDAGPGGPATPTAAVAPSVSRPAPRVAPPAARRSPASADDDLPDHARRG